MVLPGLIYPWAGNSKRMVLPGKKFDPDLGEIRGVNLVALLASEGYWYLANQGTVSGIDPSYHLKWEAILITYTHY